MTIDEKLQRECADKVHLYKEGAFWVAYEQSAYLVSQVKTLKPTKKFIKTVNKEVVSVGFPTSSLGSVTLHFVLKEERGDYNLIFEASESVSESDFLQWKENIALKISSTSVAVPVVNPVCLPKETLLLEKLKSFKLLQATPLQCVCFLEELQREFC